MDDVTADEMAQVRDTRTRLSESSRAELEAFWSRDVPLIDTIEDPSAAKPGPAAESAELGGV